MEISLKSFFPVWLKNTVKFLIFSEFRKNQLKLRKEQLELEHLQKMPRYVKSYSTLLGYKIEFIDAASFVSMYNEIFIKEIYRFLGNAAAQPYIIDCGANIGMSILYFKKLYPNARILAFEADAKVFETLQKNIKIGNFNDIILHNVAVWTEKTELSFNSEGADAGRISAVGDNLIKVPAMRLKDFLDEPVDLLKMDIEGVETEVLEDCSDKLTKVKRIFLEYHSFEDRPQTLDKILIILKNNGFRYNIHSVFNSPQPFCKLNTQVGYDLQLNIFAFK